MKGILGRKLGMTQIFDPESGSVTAVTVIEAGPCPVVQVRTAERRRLRRRPARLRAGRRPQALEGRARPPAEGRASAPTGTSSSSAASTELDVGETVTVEAFQPGDKVKVVGRLHRQGLPGHDQAPQLQARPGHPRLAQHPQARLDRRLGDSVPRLQGHADGRATWAAAASRSSGSRSTRSTSSATSCSSRARFPGPKSGFVEIREAD